MRQAPPGYLYRVGGRVIAFCVTGSHKRVALVGASGYAGQVLQSLVMHHPCMELELVTVRTGEELLAAPDSQKHLEAINACDAIALATPREPSKAWVEVLQAKARPGLKILDLSDAFRQVEGVHYGFPELFGAPPEGSTLVANPGCYPTATLGVLRPLMAQSLIEPEHISVVGASGASGAGKSPSEHLHFCNLNENIHPYNVGHHRHAPEIARHLGAPVSFVTQLLPIIRGLHVTAFVVPRGGPEALLAGLRAYYAESPWVTVADEPDRRIGVRNVVGSHQILVGVGPREHSGLVPVFSSIDNLMRGAASLALHNLNLWLGLEPGLGLPPPIPAEDGAPRAFAWQQHPYA